MSLYMVTILVLLHLVLFVLSLFTIRWGLLKMYGRYPSLGTPEEQWAGWGGGWAELWLFILISLVVPFIGPACVITATLLYQHILSRP